MYMFLHNLVMEAPDKNLNVTHTLPDLETMFGKIN